MFSSLCGLASRIPSPAKGGSTLHPVIDDGSQTDLPAWLLQSWEDYQKYKIGQKSKDIMRSLRAVADMTQGTKSKLNERRVYLFLK